LLNQYFSMRANEDWETNEEHVGYWTQVFNHFSALHGMSLDYYGADSGSCEFKLDDIVFKVLKDPDDGYRSHLGVIEYGSQSDGLFFQSPLARVKIETYEGENESYSEGNQGYRLTDIEDGHVWLEFGTDNTADYYPFFVFRHFPKENRESG